MMNSVEQGPLLESGMLSAGLDYYKPTMSQLQYEKIGDVEVTFTFKNRGEQRIENCVSQEGLQQRLDSIRERGWQADELEFFASLHDSRGERVFCEDFLMYLQDETLPPVHVRHDESIDDLAIDSTGPAPLVTFWETIIMSEVNEMYFENYVQANGLDLMEIYEEGDLRLSEKIHMLQEYPDIKFADFGTRRHFSLRWQRHVLQRLQTECPDNLLGTSNVALANTLGMKPIGTFAHEMPMIYAGLADAQGKAVQLSHNQFLHDWYDKYGDDLSIALTDTFGSEFFFRDFTRRQAHEWRGVRHDSGDAVEFGERVIEFYREHDIDPAEKTIVFSDGLNLEEIIKLQRHFDGRINTVYGWGTTLTNDLGLPALNIVAKATHVRTPEGFEADTVKLSDNPGKHTGPARKVMEYENVFRRSAVAGKGEFYYWGANYTADPIIVKDDHVLLIERGDGSWALPGGFVDAEDDSAATAAIREAWQETGLVVDRDALVGCVYEGPVADKRTTAHAWPETTALLFQLPQDGSPLPLVEGLDDAKKAFWLPIDEARKIQLYGSHNALIELALPLLRPSEIAYP